MRRERVHGHVSRLPPHWVHASWSVASELAGAHGLTAVVRPTSGSSHSSQNEHRPPSGHKVASVVQDHLTQLHWRVLVSRAVRRPKRTGQVCALADGTGGSRRPEAGGRRSRARRSVVMAGESPAAAAVAAWAARCTAVARSRTSCAEHERQRQQRPSRSTEESRTTGRPRLIAENAAAAGLMLFVDGPDPECATVGRSLTGDRKANSGLHCYCGLGTESAATSPTASIAERRDEGGLEIKECVSRFDRSRPATADEPAGKQTPRRQVAAAAGGRTEAIRNRPLPAGSIVAGAAAAIEACQPLRLRCHRGSIRRRHQIADAAAAAADVHATAASGAAGTSAVAAVEAAAAGGR